ncbi:hypothetical protein [Streptomyces mexicanus]|uniref:hypothetical protein n=1 Tax=Streptomyces mexicanus TaxID=178566 RepID=UPI0036945BE8
MSEAVPKAALRRRLLLVLFALGTDMGIKRVAVTGEHGESEAVLRRVRHLRQPDQPALRAGAAGQCHRRRPRSGVVGRGAPPARATPRSSAPGPRTS